MCVYTQLKKITLMHEVIELIHSTASSSFSHVDSACLIFLTLPVIKVTVERNFSKVRLIKTYLRNASQHYLSSLASISVERTITSRLNLEKKLSNKKAQKQKF